MADVAVADVDGTEDPAFAAASHRSCILVRAFRPLSPSPGDEYLANGMTEDLITDLARLTSARVLSRNASHAMPEGADILGHGVTHVVEVTADGYRWRETTWRSLSAIAREITGAHWSGPRFFGLDRTVKP